VVLKHEMVSFKDVLIGLLEKEPLLPKPSQARAVF
jgi:hypothetical protein